MQEQFDLPPQECENLEIKPLEAPKDLENIHYILNTVLEALNSGTLNSLISDKGHLEDIKLFLNHILSLDIREHANMDGSADRSAETRLNATQLGSIKAFLWKIYKVNYYQFRSEAVLKLFPDCHSETLTSLAYINGNEVGMLDYIASKEQYMEECRKYLAEHHIFTAN